MRRTGFGLLLIAALTVALPSVIAGENVTRFRVCGDPDNLPYSNEKGEGFENKIAEVMATDLGVPVSYFWWPHQRGLIRHTLGADACDVLIGVPKGFDPVLTTRSYYRSGYVVVAPKSVGLHIASLDDAALKQLQIGVHVDTPPYAALADRGITTNVHGYPLIFDYHDPDRSRRPEKLMVDLRAGAVDVAIVWGPIAGYFAKQNGVTFEMTPLADSGRIPMSFEMAMGVRKDNKALKARLEEALDRHQADITKILTDYGVPLFPPAPGPGAGGARGGPDGQGTGAR